MNGGLMRRGVCAIVLDDEVDVMATIEGTTTAIAVPGVVVGVSAGADGLRYDVCLDGGANMCRPVVNVAGRFVRLRKARP